MTLENLVTIHVIVLVVFFGVCVIEWTCEFPRLKPKRPVPLSDDAAYYKMHETMRQADRAFQQQKRAVNEYRCQQLSHREFVNKELGLHGMEPKQIDHFPRCIDPNP